MLNFFTVFLYVELFSPIPMLDIMVKNELQDLPHHIHRHTCEIVLHTWLPSLHRSFKYVIKISIIM